MTNAIELDHVDVGYGSSDILKDLSLEVQPGEFIAVLGPNGSGKSTLLKTILGDLVPRRGSIRVLGKSPKEANRDIGYVPQHHDFDADLPIRGRELVELGLTGRRFGLPWVNASVRRQVDEVIEEVGATAFADAPVGLLSGGEQQRLRIAQALLGSPKLLLCDEPLLALDPRRQQDAARLIDRYRGDHDAAVLFVTHEINPVLPYVDRVLYLVGAKAAIGTPDEVLTQARLSELYGAPVEVHNHDGRILVIAAEGGASELMGHHHDHVHEETPWD